MCEQCLTEAEVIFEDILPGYCLMLAKKEGQHWHTGEYALVRMDNTDFSWPGKPLVNPLAGMSDQEINALPENGVLQEFENYVNLIDQVEPHFRIDPVLGYQFVKVCMQDGYDPQKHGENIVFWLINHIARKLEQKRTG